MWRCATLNYCEVATSKNNKEIEGLQKNIFIPVLCLKFRQPMA